MAVEWNADYLQVYDWVLHSERMAEARLANARPDERPALRREVEMRKYVRQRLRGEMRGVAGVWRAYMVRHARLQIARYAGEIDEETFRREAGAALRWRNERDYNGARHR